MVAHENSYLQVWGKIEDIYQENDISEIYFIMDRSELQFSFTVYL